MAHLHSLSCLILHSEHSVVIHPCIILLRFYTETLSLLLSILCLPLLFCFRNVSWFMSICTYGSQDSLQQFFRYIPQELTSVCVLAFPSWSVRNYSIVTGLCLMCFTFHIHYSACLCHSHSVWPLSIVFALALMITLYIQGPLSSIWSASVEPGKIM